jgi:O-succinylhomoserine sulfhydrylase
MNQEHKSRRQLRPETLALRAGTQRSPFGEHSEALFLTSSFVYENAQQAADRFAGTVDGPIYSRFTNPTVDMFQQRLAALENGEACIGTASGMSAIMGCCMSLLAAGDHLIAATALFGATTTLFTGIMARFGVEHTFVNLTDPDSFKAAIKKNTKLIYIESPANPLTEIGDIRAIGAIAKKHGIVLIVDNCLATSVLQRPLELGADIVIHSATKYLDGQGRVIAGAVIGTKQYINEHMFNYLRVAGPTMSAFNAWLLLKSMETLSVRMRQHSDNGLKVAQWLESHDRVKRVFYPGLRSHPQHNIARQQQSMGGGMIAVEFHGDTPEQARANAWRVIDHCQVWSITANLGDARSTITHPSTTTHARVGEAARLAAGVTEGMLRLSVGLEHVDDLIEDLRVGLEAQA